MVIMGESNEDEWSVTLTMLRVPHSSRPAPFASKPERTQIHPSMADHRGSRGRGHSAQEMHGLIIAISKSELC
jgi:hypothetical protein